MFNIAQHMGVGAAMFGGGWQEAQEVEQRPCEGANNSERMTFQTGFRVWRHGKKRKRLSNTFLSSRHQSLRSILALTLRRDRPPELVAPEPLSPSERPGWACIAKKSNVVAAPPTEAVGRASTRAAPGASRAGPASLRSARPGRRSPPPSCGKLRSVAASPTPWSL